MIRRPFAGLLAGIAALAAAAGCRGPRSIGANVELQTEHGVVHGVSTEEGILALAEVVPATGELSFRSRAGNSFFDDVAEVRRRGDALALLAPRTSHPAQARFAARPAGGDDRLFIESRRHGRPYLLECRLHGGGALGDLLALEEAPLADVARRHAGAGLFAWRDGTMELVGILNGVYSEQPPLVAFVGLDEMSTLIPAGSDFFTRRLRTRRADFEYGTPRDFEGERAPAADPPSPADEIESPPRPPDPPAGGGALRAEG